MYKVYNKLLLTLCHASKKAMPVAILKSSLVELIRNLNALVEKGRRCGIIIIMAEMAVV